MSTIELKLPPGAIVTSFVGTTDQVKVTELSWVRAVKEAGDPVQKKVDWVLRETVGEPWPFAAIENKVINVNL
jgi:hypothetical protein